MNLYRLKRSKTFHDTLISHSSNKSAVLNVQNTLTLQNSVVVMNKNNFKLKFNKENLTKNNKTNNIRLFEPLRRDTDYVDSINIFNTETDFPLKNDMFKKKYYENKNLAEPTEPNPDEQILINQNWQHGADELSLDNLSIDALSLANKNINNETTTNKIVNKNLPTLFTIRNTNISSSAQKTFNLKEKNLNLKEMNTKTDNNKFENFIDQKNMLCNSNTTLTNSTSNKNETKNINDAILLTKGLLTLKN